jgi:hypothetical protein
MAFPTHRNSDDNSPLNWRTLKEHGILTERHILMAVQLDLVAGTIEAAHQAAGPQGSLLLEWVEDLYFTKFQSYIPMNDPATPESQAEHPSENSLVPDDELLFQQFIEQRGVEPDSPGAEEYLEEAFKYGEAAERDALMSVGEIRKEDEMMLRRQEEFRLAAKLLAKRYAEMPVVHTVKLFGSVALPLWKEVPRFSRFRQRRVKIYHECSNVDLAVWVDSSSMASNMRRMISTLVNELVANDIHFSLASHHFSVHLVDHATSRYLGMVCHFNKCPKAKPECQVAGCGAQQFVRILPWFKFKPARLNADNSQILFQRES